MKRMFSWLRGVFIGRVTPPVTDTTRTPRQPYIQKPCAACGRKVAHTRSNRAWWHDCPAVKSQTSSEPKEAA